MKRLKLGSIPLIVCCLLFLLIGCVPRLTAPVVDIKTQPAIGEKIPLNVGILIPDAMENFTYDAYGESSASVGGMTYPIGKLVKNISVDAFTQLFENIKIIKGTPYPTDIDAIIIPKFEDLHYKLQGTFDVEVIIEISMKISVIDSNGGLLLERTVKSPSIRKSVGVFSQSKDIGTAAAEAMASVFTNISENMATSQEVHNLTSIRRKGTTTASIPYSQHALPLISKSDVDTLPSKKAKTNKTAYAIVVGIESYRQKLPKADFAAHDAQTVTEYLTKVMGYPEENVVTLTNDKASKSDFEKYFGKWLSNNVEKGGSVFVYFSGHGAPNPKTGDAYLVPYDGDPAFIDETGYPLNKLYEQLGKLPAKEIIVALDSCFSGGGGRSVIAKGARPLVMNMKANAIPPKVAVLSAASGEQISSTYDEKGHGLFTYFMLKGLKGEAEMNGSVDIGNLFEYIKPQVERIARKSYNNEQTPQLIAPKELTGIRLR